MDAPGRITQSGLLYEANFPEWRTRMTALLQLHGLRSFTYSGCCTSTCSIDDPQWNRAFNLMKNQIRPALLRRVPEIGRRCPCNLWRNLEELCQPFRLLDLPEEVRRRIYAYGAKRPKQEKYGRFLRPKPLPLSIVNRQLRRETGLLWIKKHKFRLGFSCEEPYDPDTFARHIRTWAESLGTPNLKLLREVRIFFYRGATHDGPHLELQIEFSEKSGLSMICWDARCADAHAPHPDMEKMLDHEESCEADRKALGLEGEGIVLALITKAAFWGELLRDWLRDIASGKLEY